MPELYRIQIGQDRYVGTAAEVVAFMARADGAPGSDATTYMEAVAKRVHEQLGIDGIAVSDPAAFLDSLSDRGVVKAEVFGLPSKERHDRDEVLGDGLISFSSDVDPADVDLD